MAKYHFLYRGLFAKAVIFQSDIDANSESEARAYFGKHYAAEMIVIRKGRPYSDSEIVKHKQRLKYG